MTVDPSTAPLHGLREAHRQLDAEIAAMQAAADAAAREVGGSAAAPDQLALARLKKRKLRLRDEIERAADAAVPDIIA